MQRGEVIGLEEGIDEHLPVHSAVQNARRVVMIVVELVARELRTEPVEFLPDIEARTCFGLNPYTAETLARGKCDEAVGVTIDSVEVPVVRNAHQFPFRPGRRTRISASAAGPARCDRR